MVEFQGFYLGVVGVVRWGLGLQLVDHFELLVDLLVLPGEVCFEVALHRLCDVDLVLDLSLQLVDHD